MSAPPIPLSSPDGVIYAYVCPRCNCVGMICGLSKPYGSSDIATIAKHSYQNADRCCRCRICGIDIKPGKYPHECDVCESVQEGIRNEETEKFITKAKRNIDMQEESLTKSLDRDSAIKLRDFMSQISEDYYCAGWLMGLESKLWGIILAEEPNTFGMGSIEKKEMNELKILSEKCGGWWRFDDEYGEIFVPIDEWRNLYVIENVHIK